MSDVQHNRFAVVYGATMMELAGKMNKLAHPLARLVYFGENKGDYSNTEIYSDEYRQALFIAVFDIMPVQVNLVDEFTYIPEGEELDSTNDENKLAMAA